MDANLSWSAEPAVLLGVGAAGVLYVGRWQSVRTQHGARGAPVARLGCFLAGLALVVLALISPIDALSEQLFSAHMVQHVLLLDLAPILCICGLTRMILRPATRRLRGVEESLGAVGHPGIAIALYVGGVWSWHIPALYDAALRHPALHLLEHVVYATVGSLYWWHLLSPIRGRMRLGGMGPAAYMATTKLLIGLLGIALVFAPGDLYAFYSGGVWGLSRHNDQSLAGAIMALEQSLVMGVALAIIFMRMLSESERVAQRDERRERDAVRGDVTLPQ